MCVDVDLVQQAESPVRIMKCHGEKAGQQWLYLEVSKFLAQTRIFTRFLLHVGWSVVMFKYT